MVDVARCLQQVASGHHRIPTVNVLLTTAVGHNRQLPEGGSCRGSGRSTAELGAANSFKHNCRATAGELLAQKSRFECQGNAEGFVTEDAASAARRRSGITVKGLSSLT